MKNNTATLLPFNENINKMGNAGIIALSTFSEDNHKKSFMDAVICNNLSKVEKLLRRRKYKINVNEVIISEYTALRYAVKYQNTNLMKLLLKYGANEKLVDKNGDNCLHFAVRSCNIKLVRFFLNSINVNTLNNLKFTPLHEAVEKNKYDIVLLLLNKKANVNAQTSIKHYTPLHIAVKNKNIPLMELLLNHGADSNIQDHEKYSPFYNLFYVFQSNINNNLIDLFLLNGARFDFKDIQGNTVIHLAAYFGTHEFLQKLLQMNLNISVRNKKGLTPMHCAIDLQKSPDKISLLSSRIKTEMFIKHIALLSSQNIHVCNDDKIFINSKPWTLVEYNNYQKELSNMQATKVSIGIDLTYYDILVKRNNALVYCLKYETVRSVMNSGSYKKLFIHFSSQLEANYLHGLQIFQTIDKSQTIFQKLLRNS